MNALTWIANQQDQLVQMVCRWSNLNTGSGNLAGLDKFSNELLAAYAELRPDHVERRAVQCSAGPSIPLLILRKRVKAARRIFLFGHLDSVFGPDHPFQTVTVLAHGRIRGPGMCDMKGGLAVLLHGLWAFERFIEDKRLGWTIAINSDEEIGSPASSELLVQEAQGHPLAFGFEPALASGAIASERRGSGAFLMRFHGRAAHSGRNPHDGRNALVPLAHFVLRCQQLNAARPSIFLNPAEVTGGTALNMVPEMAACRLNVRTSSPGDEAWILQALHAFAEHTQRTSDYRVEVQGRFTAPPKACTPEIQQLISLLQETGGELGQTIGAEPTGGTCDGNRLAAAGIPNVDNLGVCGGQIHSAEEFIVAESLVQRSQLLYATLTKLNGTV
jgi:glutamate carboxypeptidase